MVVHSQIIPIPHPEFRSWRAGFVLIGYCLSSEFLSPASLAGLPNPFRAGNWNSARDWFAQFDSMCPREDEQECRNLSDNFHF